MKRLLVLTFTLAALLSAPVFAQQSQVIDGIAAVVNGDVVTYSQVREVIAAQERALRSSYQGAELEAKIKEVRVGALKELIDRQLVLQEFKKKEKEGATIPPYIIDEEIQKAIRQEFGGDRAAFVRTLKSMGTSLTKYREIRRDKIILAVMRSQYVKDDFVISPTQIQAYYDKHRLEYSTPEQVKLRMIVLREDENSDTGLAGGKKEMAKEIRAKLVAGAEFGRLAQMYSEDPTTQQLDGDWGWLDKKTLSEELTNHAFALRAGEISDVIQIGSSYYIMMVEARKNAASKPIQEVRDEIEQNLRVQEQKKAAERWLDTLRQNAYIKIYS
jgi:peptidyl-prolyl cis-trans isomerase SurA